MPEPDTKISFEELETEANRSEAAKPNETTTVTPPATGSTTVTEETKPQFTEVDVAAYRQLSDMGITVETAKQFKEAKNALDNLPLILKNNPNVLLDEIAKNDPALASQLEEVISDRWFARYQREHPEDSGKNGVSRTTPSAPDPRVDDLTREVKALREERQQERTEKENARITQGWNKAFEELEAKLPEGTTARDREYIRLKAEKMLWQDGQAQGRVNKGVYIDVPKYYAEATKRVTAETKAAANDEHSRRSNVRDNASKEIVPAAENVNGSRDTESKDIWDDKQMGREAAALFAGKK